jgi:hypothetical protein
VKEEKEQGFSVVLLLLGSLYSLTILLYIQKNKKKRKEKERFVALFL